MKKILFLGALQSGGAEHQMVIIARLLKDAGYDVTYFCGSSNGFFQNELEDAGIPIIRIKENRLALKLRLNTLYISNKVRKILKTGRYDTVISFLGLWNFLNCKYANKKGTEHRAITGIRNNRDEVFLNRQSKYYTKFERFAYRKVSNSDAARIKFGNYFPYLKEKLMTIYNIVDLPQITSSYQCKGNGKVNIIVPASYRSVKNPMGLLNAIVLLDDEEQKHIHIDWYGNIKEGVNCYEEMKQFINNHHIEEIVSLHDVTTEIANRINEADVVGLFSTSEGLPNAICEGMMLGKPIVMTRVSDYETLAGGGNGFLCDADNNKSIAEALSLVSQLTAQEMIKMGALSKEKACSLFSKESVITQWINII